MQKIHRLRQAEGLDRGAVETQTVEELARLRAEKQLELAKKVETTRAALRGDPRSYRRKSIGQLQEGEPEASDAQHDLIRKRAPPDQEYPAFSHEDDREVPHAEDVNDGYLGDGDYDDGTISDIPEEADDLANRKRKRPVKDERDINPSPEHFQARHRDLYIRHQQSAAIPSQEWRPEGGKDDRWTSDLDKADERASSDDGSDSDYVRLPKNGGLTLVQTQPRADMELTRDVRPPDHSESLHPLHRQGKPQTEASSEGNFLTSQMSGRGARHDEISQRRRAEIESAVVRGSGRPDSYYINPPLNMTPHAVEAAAAEIVEATMRDHNRPQPPRIDQLDVGPPPITQRELLSGKRCTQAEFRVYRAAKTPPWDEKDDRSCQDRSAATRHDMTHLPFRDGQAILQVQTAVIETVHDKGTPVDQMKRKGGLWLAKTFGNNLSSATMPTDDTDLLAVCVVCIGGISKLSRVVPLNACLLTTHCRFLLMQRLPLSRQELLSSCDAPRSKARHALNSLLYACLDEQSFHLIHFTSSG